MNIIIFGPQGSGKGTQADLLAKKYKLYHLSMGDELRAEIKKGSAIGKKVQPIMEKGNLVPNSITNNMLLDISKRKEAKRGIILDGYPRNMEQYEFVKKNIKINAAIELHIPDSESVKRIASRRICPKCGKNYNLIWLKPKKSGHCDIDGAKLTQRNDDMPIEIKNRLKIYHSQTSPIKQKYKKHDVLYVIDGSRSIKTVHKEIVKILDKL